ncbi:hypothetical protein DC3_57280 [Deinococcus cellulosilyticus NBRC 106333 = KACC 11606]|uniref:Uncharacterized protein n=2 Tax=Deinococcus cellulosilyticus TaxID=401558 RepID=A0A511NBE1_DEIC1|nr:hypothetical protein DC3_57280 [Deinococcus cellulosilyticus NBRC 106333 = KACC 11606]
MFLGIAVAQEQLKDFDNIGTRTWQTQHLKGRVKKIEYCSVEHHRDCFIDEFNEYGVSIYDLQIRKSVERDGDSLKILINNDFSEGFYYLQHRKIVREEYSGNDIFIMIYKYEGDRLIYKEEVVTEPTHTISFSKFFGYKYDNNGNLVEETFRDEDVSFKTVYDWNSKISKTYENDSTNPTEVIHFVVDEQGNIIKEFKNGILVRENTIAYY